MSTGTRLVAVAICSEVPVLRAQRGWAPPDTWTRRRWPGAKRWAVALIVVLIIRNSLPPAERWWVWTCATGLALGLFGLWYVPRLKRGRARAAARRAEGPAGQSSQAGQSAPRDSGSNTVSSTDTPGKSAKS